MKPTRIAVVEDHEILREMTVAALDAPDFLVQGYASGEALLQALGEIPPDIAVLDVNLPGINGFVLAQRLRQQNPAVSILMLTVRDSTSDKISGYGSGADIYLPKPVDDQELLAAVSALARRTGAAPATDITAGTVSGADAARWHLSADGWTFFTGSRALPLTAQERCFLQSLSSRCGQAVSREVLAEELGEAPHEYDFHRLDSLVSRLRRKAGDAGVVLPLRAVRGVGYLLAR